MQTSAWHVFSVIVKGQEAKRLRGLPASLHYKNKEAVEQSCLPV